MTNEINYLKKEHDQNISVYASDKENAILIIVQFDELKNVVSAEYYRNDKINVDVSDFENDNFEYFHTIQTVAENFLGITLTL